VRPLLPRRSTKNAESKWALAVKKRDDYECRLEEYNARPRLTTTIYIGAGWSPCFKRGTDAAHIFRRSEAGKLRFADPVLGICACREHHDRLHRMDKKVRIPPKAVEAARRYLMKAVKNGSLRVAPKGGR
jgi:hypothetical protein